MSDDSNRVSRRTALKGIAAFAGAGAVGTVGINHAAEPAAAVEHLVSIDDVVVETTNGEVSELGISDLWFELSWENIPEDVRCHFEFDDPLYSFGDPGNLGVSGDGTETFGFGEAYADQYDVDLASHDGFEHLDFPLSTTDADYLETSFHLDDDAVKLTNTVSFVISLWDYREDGGNPSLGGTSADFDVIVERVDPEAEVGDGEGDAFGEE